MFVPKLYICLVNKKDSILRSALALLVEKGVHNTPMSAIAKNAGTGMGTIYNYFPNKEVLINEIYAGIKEKENTIFPEFDTARPIKTQFERYYTAMVEFFIENAEFFKFMEQVQASPIITEETRKKGLETVAPVYDLLERGKEERIVKNLETEELIQFIGGSVFSYLRWYHGQVKVGASTVQNQVRMVWDGIKE